MVSSRLLTSPSAMKYAVSVRCHLDGCPQDDARQAMPPIVPRTINDFDVVEATCCGGSCRGCVRADGAADRDLASTRQDRNPEPNSRNSLHQSWSDSPASTSPEPGVAIGAMNDAAENAFMSMTSPPAFCAEVAMRAAGPRAMTPRRRCDGLEILFHQPGRRVGDHFPSRGGRTAMPVVAAVRPQPVRSAGLGVESRLRRLFCCRGHQTFKAEPSRLASSLLSCCTQSPAVQVGLQRADGVCRRVVAHAAGASIIAQGTATVINYHRSAGSDLQDPITGAVRHIADARALRTPRHGAVVVLEVASRYREESAEMIAAPGDQARMYDRLGFAALTSRVDVASRGGRGAISLRRLYTDKKRERRLPGDAVNWLTVLDLADRNLEVDVIWSQFRRTGHTAKRREDGIWRARISHVNWRQRGASVSGSLGVETSREDSRARGSGGAVASGGTGISSRTCKPGVQAQRGRETAPLRQRTPLSSVRWTARSGNQRNNRRAERKVTIVDDLDEVDTLRCLIASNPGQMSLLPTVSRRTGTRYGGPSIIESQVLYNACVDGCFGP
ncbi:unnamed protein product, partial [Mesorhabditis spiculigera]